MKKVNFAETLKRMHQNISDNEEDYEKHLKEQRENEIEEEKRRYLCELDKAGLPRNKKETTLDTIVPKTTQQGTLVDVLNEWDKYKDFRLPYVFGPPGVGKSFVSIAFANGLVQAGFHEVRFFTMSQFIIKYRDYGKQENIDDLILPSTLILDDFGAHNITKNTIEMLHASIDYRLMNEKPTLITSNVAMNKISKFLFDTGKGYGITKILCDAIEDRIFELCSICILKGQSIRELEAMERVKQARATKPAQPGV